MDNAVERQPEDDLRKESVFEVNTSGFKKNRAGLKKKHKKNIAKDIGEALKAKRKVASFFEKAEQFREKEKIMRGEVDNEESSGSEDVELDGLESERKSVEKPGVSLNSIDFESLMVDSDEYDDVPIPHMRQFSTGIFYRKLTSNSILVSIEPAQKLHFAGKAIVQVLKGTANIYGYHFGADGNKYTVFSAKGHSSLVFIEALRKGNNNDTIIFKDHHIENVSQEEIASAKGLLIVLEGFENEWCEGIRQMHPSGVNFIGPSITGIGPGNIPPLKNFLEKLGFQFVSEMKTDKCRLLNFPAYFDNIFRDITTKYDIAHGRICPFGGQGVGKSTFVRWLTNRFLSDGIGKVLFIDLDPGQTEFTPPGVLSVHICTEPILGPNFSHLKLPLRSIFLGGVNTSDNPITYIKGVAELFEFCSSQAEFGGIPWVINTMGFSKGLGVDFACEIIRIIRPHYVIQLNIDNEKRSFPFYLNKENVTKHGTYLSQHLASKYKQTLGKYIFLSVNSPCNRGNSNISSWGVTSKVAREITLISYFADTVGSTEDFSILSVVPQYVPLDSIAIGSINSNLNYDEIVATLNGNLVALCQMSDAVFETVPESSRKFVRNAGNFVINFFGYGIVRAVDNKKTVLYLLTTLQESDRLAKVNVILGAGAVGLPVNFYVTANKKNSGPIPYVMQRDEGTSTLHTAAKKFFVPKRVVHPILKNSLL